MYYKPCQTSKMKRLQKFFNQFFAKLYLLLCIHLLIVTRQKIHLQKSLHNRTDFRDLQEIYLFPLKIVTRRFMRKLPNFTLCKLLRKLFNIWRITDQDNPRKLARCFRWNLVIVNYGLQFNGEFFQKSFFNGRRAQILW